MDALNGQNNKQVLSYLLNYWKSAW